MKKICILGTGSFGTSLAIHLSKNFSSISMWSNDLSVVNEINNNRTNSKYLKDIPKIDNNISATLDLKSALQDSTYIIMAVPSHVVPIVASQLQGLLLEEQIIVNLAKGLDENTLNRLSVSIQNNSKHTNIVALSGPSHAEEIVKNVPTAIVAASTDIHLAEAVQRDFSTKTLRIYTNDDIIGVELGGAAKNIIALGAGVLNGLNYGDNTKAALMVRGMHEISSIGIKLGGNPQTFNGLSGIGDLIVTCTSEHSRNNQAGKLIAQGFSINEIQDKIGMVVEGIKACKCFYELSTQLDIELPITTALYNILFNNSNVEKEVSSLLKRAHKNEFFN